MSGRLRWRHRFNAGTPEPNGIAIADGRVFESTDTTAVALDPRSHLDLRTQPPLIRDTLSVVYVIPPSTASRNQSRAAAPHAQYPFLNPPFLPCVANRYMFLGYF